MTFRRILTLATIAVAPLLLLAGLLAFGRQASAAPVSDFAIGAFSIDGNVPTLVYDDLCLPLDGAQHQLEVRVHAKGAGFATNGRYSEDDGWITAIGGAGKVITGWQGWNICFSPFGPMAARDNLIAVDPNSANNPVVEWETFDFPGPTAVLTGPLTTTVDFPESYLVQAEGEPYFTYNWNTEGCPNSRYCGYVWSEPGLYTVSVEVLDWWGAATSDTLEVTVFEAPGYVTYLPAVFSSPNYCQNLPANGVNLNGAVYTQGCHMLNRTTDTFAAQSTSYFASNIRGADYNWFTVVGGPGEYTIGVKNIALICVGTSPEDAMAQLISSDPNAGNNPILNLESSCTPAP